MNSGILYRGRTKAAVDDDAFQTINRTQKRHQQHYKTTTTFSVLACPLSLSLSLSLSSSSERDPVQNRERREERTFSKFVFERSGDDDDDDDDDDDCGSLFVQRQRENSIIK